MAGCGPVRLVDVGIGARAGARGTPAQLISAGARPCFVFNVRNVTLQIFN